ncbi:MAG TPA: 3-hydroxyacyl-CoA dehydrogenase NAD-binding domain-containing protein [Labilithrix sp.]|nr:3-hydroxyacyl-CoA dehydrogenase NAD-binding domain-containing protein [Labilithrix sp.]
MAAQATTLSSASSDSGLPALVKAETRRDGVLVITLDAPAESHNTITPFFTSQLDSALDAAAADPSVRAVVLASGKKDTFLAGENLEFLRTIRFAQDGEDTARALAKSFARLGALRPPASSDRSASAFAWKPVVAYVHGPALGAGFELALACTAAIASDDPKTTFALPEVKHGLLPAGNGLLRVAERAGLLVALDLGLSGRNVIPAEALRLGLVDDVVPTPVGLDAAIALALRLATDTKAYRALTKARARIDRASRARRAVLEQNPLGRSALFRWVRAESAKHTRGHYPAPAAIIEVLSRFGARGFRSAAELEPRLFGDLVVSATAHRLIDRFFAERALKKDTGVESKDKTTPFEVDRVAVLGAGLMGAGIAALSAQAGLDVRMKDTDDAAIGRGLRYVSNLLDDRVRRAPKTANIGVPDAARRERDVVFSRISGATDYTGFRNVDLVFEAVFEDLELKHRVIRDVEKVVRDTCVIASNTSSIPIARIAEASSRPEMVVGMHYGRPVHKKPLVEIVRTKRTDPRAVATAVALGKKQGKAVIVVRDGVAFYTTRILVPYLNEALYVLAEGASVEVLDAALVDWGFPVGPLMFLDEIGIDSAAHVVRMTEEAFGDRLRSPAPLLALRADDRRGKKNARGLYLYGSAAPLFGGKAVDSTVYKVLGGAPRPEIETPSEIALRCALAMVNEALRCYEEGIIRSARDGDVGAVLGVGFPAFRGGPFRYVDVLGATEVLRRMRVLEQRFGARFEPASVLVEMARGGKRFYG